MSASNSERLDAAQRGVAAIAQLDLAPDLAAAYRIQHELIGHRLARGERLVGCKLGFTSKAKMAQMGVSEIIVGRLTDAMRIGDGADVDLTGFIHPRVEPEVAFRLSRQVDLDDPATDIASCVDAVAPAIEIIDSRYQDFRFTVTDVVADNTSAGRYVVGTPVDPQGIDLRLVGVVLEKNGKVSATASGAAVLGHPASAVAWLARQLWTEGEGLQAGEIVLSGGLTAAVPVASGDVVVASIDRLGSVELGCR